MNIGDIFTILFTQPITNVLVAFYKALIFLHIPFALGFAIILLTIFIRIILYPFVSAQIKSAHKMQKVAPHVARIREQHKKDAKRQQEELMRIYKEHGVNPAAGCLPLLIQLPVIWALYGVLTNIVGATTKAAIAKINATLYFPFLKIDAVWDPYFFGVSLAAVPSKLLNDNPFILIVPIITAVFQFILSKMMIPEETDKTKKDLPEARKSKGSDFQSAFQTQSLYIFPIMIGFFSYTLPVGLSLYWNTFTVFGILQQYLLVGPGGLAPWMKKLNIPYGKRK